MSDLYIPAGADTPEIDFKFSRNCLNLVGEAYPENAIEFFRPVLKQFQAYVHSLTNRQFVEMTCDLTYCNSVSTKILYILFRELNEYAQSNPDCVLLNWYHDADDDMIESLGQDLHKDFGAITFKDMIKV